MISQTLRTLHTNDARMVFGHPDNMRLKSSMTLFANASANPQVVLDVLDKCFNGKQDSGTLKILGKQDL